MKLKRFFVFSVLAHAIVFSGIYFLPASGVKKQTEFFTRLVSPEEILKPEIKQPEKQSRTPPAEPPLLKKEDTVPAAPPAPQPLPPPTFLPSKPRVAPSTEKPVVPGEGKETGKPLPDGIKPKEGKEGARGESAEREQYQEPGYEDRGKLFDPKIIGDIAKKDVTEESKKDDAITFDTREYRYAGYMRKLKEKIENIWIYPPEARARGLYGDLKIRFVIEKDGRIGLIELVRTSGYKMLDDAAMKALKDGEPYWPLPEEWGMESYPVLGHFIYNIYGYRVR